MLSMIPLCYHLNEMFMFWGLLVALIILYRTFFAKKEMRLTRLWSLYAIAWIGIAWLSGGSVSARSGGGMPSIADIFREMLACDPMVPIINLLIIMGLLMLSLSVFQWHLIGMIKTVMTAILLVLDLYYIFTRAGRLAGSCFNLRFCNLAAGVVFSLILLTLFAVAQKITMQNLSVLLVALCIIGCSYNIVTAAEFHHLNDDLCSYAQASNHIGYIEDNSTSIFEKNHIGYRWDWSLAHQCVAAQVLRGHTDIHCIVIGSDYVYDPTDKNNYCVYSQYGITLSLP